MLTMSTKHLLAAAVAAVLLLGACGTSESGDDSTTLSLVGFAVPEAANKAIQAEWAKTEAGKDVRWATSYGPSGDQSRAVVTGLDADYVHFSVESDVTRLVDAGLVDPSWKDGPTNGVVSSSVVVLGPTIAHTRAPQAPGPAARRRKSPRSSR